MSSDSQRIPGSAVTAALVEAEQAADVLAATAAGLKTLHERLVELSTLVTEASAGPQWRRGSGAAIQIQVDSLLGRITGLVHRTQVVGVTPLRGLTLRLGCMAGEPTFVLKPMTVESLGGEGVGKLADLAAGGAANLASGDVSAAQRIVAAAIDEVSQTAFGLRVFQTQVVAMAIRSLSASRDILAAIGADADVPFWEPAGKDSPAPARTEPAGQPETQPGGLLSFGANS